MAKAGTDNDFLAMALIGYEAQIAKIKAAISDIQARLGHRGPGRPRVAGGAAPTKRTMSAAARRRIAAAQRKRWAAVKSQAQAKSAPKPAAPKKRKMSASARKRIGDAARKRWAAVRKAGGKKKAAAS